MTTGNINRPTYNHLSSEELLLYFHGNLSDTEKNRIQKHLESCELCSDAMKGISEMTNALRIHTVTRDIRRRMVGKRFRRIKLFSGFYWNSLITLITIIVILLLLAVYFLIIQK